MSCLFCCGMLCKGGVCRGPNSPWKNNSCDWTGMAQKRADVAGTPWSCVTLVRDWECRRARCHLPPTRTEGAQCPTVTTYRRLHSPHQTFQEAWLLGIRKRVIGLYPVYFCGHTKCLWSESLASFHPEIYLWGAVYVRLSVHSTNLSLGMQ